MRVTRPGGSGAVGARDMPEPLRLLLVALRFMTRLPLPRVEFREGDLRRASALFPLVGAVVAGIGIGVRAALEPPWGGSVATVGALAAMIVLTGALHEDGLADTADGLWGGWTPARRLEIMRDSRLGTYGIVALIVVLGLRASLLLPLGLAQLLPPAGDSAFAGGEPGRPRLGVAVAGPLDLAGALAAAGVVVLTVVLATGAWAAVPLVAGALTCLLCAELFRRRLGGITGDTLGAASLLLAQVHRPAPDAHRTALERAGDQVQVGQLLVEQVVVHQLVVLAVALGVLGLQVRGREEPFEDRIDLTLGEHRAELVGEAPEDGDLLGAQADAEAVRPHALDRGHSAVLLHSGPEAVVVQPVDVVLGLLPRAARHHRLALVVDVEHQLGRLLLGIAEQFLEHEHHVRHQVDGVVPHDHDPGDVGGGDVLFLWRALAHRGGRAHALHPSMVANPSWKRKVRARTPVSPGSRAVACRRSAG